MSQNIRKRSLAILAATFILLAGSTSVKAQFYNTLYWMQGIPQSGYSNPGIQPLPGFYLGIPGASSLYFGLNHTGFAPMDLIKRNEATQKLYIDDQSMLSKLKPLNFMSADYQHEILAFGFQSKKDYFSFNLTEKVGSRLAYSSDFMHLLVNGNDYFMQQGIDQGEEVPAKLDGLAIDAIHYREFGFGYSRKWTDQFSAGLRAKVLQGLGSVDFERSDLSLTTQPNNYELLLRANLLVNSSLPFVLQPIDSLGSDTDFNFDDDKLVNYLTNTRNMGFAIDLGAEYKINDKFSVALSILDLGFINWKSDVENFAMNGEFEFTGIDFNDFFNSDEDNDNSFDQVIDSIQGIFDIEETMSAYRTLMPAKLFVSATFSPTTMHRFAVLARGEYYAETLHPSFGVSYNFQPVSWFGSTLSYSVINRNYNNVGLGFHVNLGPLQLYTVVDNFLGAMRPHTVQTATVHFGLNIVAKTRTKYDPTAPSFRW